MDHWSQIRAVADLERRQRPEVSGLAGLSLAEALLAAHDYQVVRYPNAHPLLGGAWAALFPDIGIAACDTGLTPERQAFALAHELGHLLLHEGTAACESVDFDPDADPADTRSGPLETYNPRQQRELESNVFALQLLLPREHLWRLFVEEGIGAAAIADRLGMSFTATLNALAGLLRPAEARGAGDETQPAGTRALDPSQLAAATITGRPALVQAGPGTGKTGTLIGRVLFLVQERGVAPHNILVLTFSNRAAGEVRERLAAALGNAALTIMVCTFHAFAYELLRRYSTQAGIRGDSPVLDTAATLVLLRTHLGELGIGHAISLDRPIAALAALLEVVGRAKDELIDARTFGLREAALPESDDQTRLQATFYTGYERILQNAGALDYGDLILRAVRLLRDHEDLRSETQATYSEVLVDEYQDINRAAAELLELLVTPVDGSLPAGLWAVGDPLQSIYRWRGATPEALTDFQSRYPGAMTVSLAVNYRSRGPIVALISGVARAISDEAADTFRWQAAREPGAMPAAPITLAVASDAEAEMEGIAEEIAASIRAGRLASDHAVLCATHAQADRMATMLTLAGLEVDRTPNPLDEPAVRRALAVLAVADGEADALLLLVTNGPAEQGLHRDTALLLVQDAAATGTNMLTALEHPPEELPADQRQAARSLGALIRSLPVTRRGEAWPSLARYLFDGPAPAARPLLGNPEHPHAGTALSALLACARRYDLQPDALRAASLPSHVRLLLATGEGLRDTTREVDGHGVRVLTMHGAKGLEFPVVFLPNLAQGRFPTRGRGGPSIVPGLLGINDEQARAADNRSLFFVALSRARDRLVLSRAERYGNQRAEPSPLLALTDELFATQPPVQVRWSARASETQGGGTPTEGTLPADPPRRSTGADEPEPSARAVSPDVASSSERLSGELLPVDVDAHALETYLRCPRRFYYEYRLGLKGAPEGQGFPHYHRVLRRAVARMLDLNTGADDLRLEVLDQEWAEPHEEHPYEELYLERARAAVLALQMSSNTPVTMQNHNVDYPVVRPGGVVRVRIDRLDSAPDGTPTAVRYRSGKPDDGHRRDHRSALYQAALHAEHGSGQVQQEYLLSRVIDSRQVRGSTVASRLAECDEALAGIARGEFPARKGGQCVECPFWLICPIG